MIPQPIFAFDSASGLGSEQAFFFGIALGAIAFTLVIVALWLVLRRRGFFSRPRTRDTHREVGT